MDRVVPYWEKGRGKNKQAGRRVARSGSRVKLDEEQRTLTCCKWKGNRHAVAAGPDVAPQASCPVRASKQASQQASKQGDVGKIRIEDLMQWRGVSNCASHCATGFSESVRASSGRVLGRNPSRD